MRWHERHIWKAGIAIVGMLLSLVLMTWLPLSAVGAHETTQLGSTTVMETGTVQGTATLDLTVTALAKEQTKQQVDKLQRENLFPWAILNAVGSSIGTMCLALAGFATALIGFNQWRGNRQDEYKKREKEQEHWQKDREEERRKQDEGRFQVVVAGLGSEREEAKVGAAIVLRTFVQQDYKQFYSQAFDLAVAHLRLPRTSDPPKDSNTPLPLTTLSQAVIVVFKEAFPGARSQNKGSPESLDASDIQLDNAYLRGADLEQVWMPQASLQQVNLSEAHLRGANLNNADLRGADLRETDLRGADLRETDLRGADLRETDLRGADLRGADLRETDLSGVNLEYTHFLKDTKLCGVEGLTKEQLEACKAKGAIIDEDPTASSPQSTVSTPLLSQSNDVQAQSALSAQGIIPTSETNGSSAPSS